MVAERTERELMLAGEMYLSADPALRAMRRRARRLLRQLNQAAEDEDARRAELVRELLGAIGDQGWIEPPFYCDYGCNIYVGARLYANFNCVILDCAEVRLGDDVMLAPGVQIYTAYHPIDAQARISGRELARPVTIGSRVWLGGGVIVLPGVTIGDETVVGAGSVVTRSLPAGVVAAGNPCRVLRAIGKDGAGS